MSSPLMAKVFNGENRSCPGVLVSLKNSRGEIHKIQTDITGKALFPPLPFDEYEVSLSKKGYEKVLFSFSFTRPDQAIYGRLYSSEYLLNRCFQHMEDREYIKAQKWLNRAILLETNEELTLFFSAIILWKTGFPHDAANKLEEFQRQTSMPEKIPEEMIQFLADLYTNELKEELNETVKTDI